MYSKEKGFTKAPVVEGYARRPGRTPRVSVPPNYRGHAIVDGEERGLGVSEDAAVRSASNLLPSTDTPVPRFENLPRISRLGDSRHDRPPSYLPSYGGYTVSDYGEGSTRPQEDEASGEAYAPSADDGDEGGRLPSLPAPPPPPRRFGGILSLGLEELLLLGLILFLLREGETCSDRGDLDETVILLGLLLLLG